MNYLFYENETEIKGRVTLTYGVTPPPNLLSIPHVEVENIPDPERIAGKNAMLYVNPQTGELWYEYTDRPLTPEEEMVQLKAEQALMKKAMDDLIFNMGGAL